MKKEKSSSPVVQTTADGGSRISFSYVVYTWGPVIAFSLLIFFQSAYPSLEQPHDLPDLDKLAHGCIYALLAFLCYRALRTLRFGRRSVMVFIFSALLSTLYGVSDEFHQHFVATRTAEIMDVAADMAGSIVGAGAAWRFYGK